MAEIDQRADEADRPAGGTTAVLVVYATQHGATRGVAARIAARLGERGLRVDLRHVGDAGDPGGYDAVVFGSPVYDQSWPPEADAFVRRHLGTLADRPMWLFSVGTFGDCKRLIGPLMVREPKGITELRSANARLRRTEAAGNRGWRNGTPLAAWPAWE